MPVSKNSHRKYNLSEKGLARVGRFRGAHPNYWYNSAAYQKERRQRIQDEACCHCVVEDFYPAFRFKQSFDGAEVVKLGIYQPATGMRQELRKVLAKKLGGMAV